jgi:hypothetical protein
MVPLVEYVHVYVPWYAHVYVRTYHTMVPNWYDTTGIAIMLPICLPLLRVPVVPCCYSVLKIEICRRVRIAIRTRRAQGGDVCPNGAFVVT